MAAVTVPQWFWSLRRENLSLFLLLSYYVLYPEKSYPLSNVSEIFPFHAEMCQTFLSHCHPSIKIWGSSLTLDPTLASVEQLGVTGNLVLWSVMGLDWLSSLLVINLLVISFSYLLTSLILDLDKLWMAFSLCLFLHLLGIWVVTHSLVHSINKSVLSVLCWSL